MNKSGQPWTTTDVKIMRREYKKTPTPELAEKLGRTTLALHKMAQELELAEERKPASDEEIREMIYDGKHVHQIARALGITSSGVRSRMTAFSIEDRAKLRENLFPDLPVVLKVKPQ